MHSAHKKHKSILGSRMGSELLWVSREAEREGAGTQAEGLHAFSKLPPFIVSMIFMVWGTPVCNSGHFPGGLQTANSCRPYPTWHSVLAKPGQRCSRIFTDKCLINIDTQEREKEFDGEKKGTSDFEIFNKTEVGTIDLSTTWCIREQ